MKLPLTATALVCVGAAGIAVGALVLEPASPSAAPAPVAPAAVATVPPAVPPGGYVTTVPGAPATAAPPVAPAAAAAEIRGFAFATSPVAPGATVTVTNRDDAGHTFTADAFDTGTIAGGSSATFTAPSAPGSYPIVCEIHPSMTGTLVVG
jgi:plastocyanin